MRTTALEREIVTALRTAARASADTPAGRPDHVSTLRWNLAFPHVRHIMQSYENALRRYSKRYLDPNRYYAYDVYVPTKDRGIVQVHIASRDEKTGTLTLQYFSGPPKNKRLFRGLIRTITDPDFYEACFDHIPLIEHRFHPELHYDGDPSDNADSRAEALARRVYQRPKRGRYRKNRAEGLDF